MSIYFVESKRPIRGTVIELLRNHNYTVVDNVGRRCMYVETEESILDVLEVVEQETGAEFESIVESTNYTVQGHIDMCELVDEEEVLLEIVPG